MPNAPLNADLLQDLANAATFPSCAELMAKYPEDDIEIALTKLDIEIESNPISTSPSAYNPSELRESIVSELARFFTNFHMTEDLIEITPWLKELISSIFSDGDVAISLNYDCVLEGSLDVCDKWSCNGGYGSIRHQLTSGDHESPVKVLKIHGSSSFIRAPSIGGSVQYSISFEINDWFFPRSGNNRHFGYGAGRGNRYVIAPSYLKLPPIDIAYLMLDAMKATTDAENLVVIGSRLRKEDTFLWFLIANFLRQPNWLDRKIVIVDLNANEIATRISEYWSVDVSGQLVPIEGELKDSIPALSKIVS